MSIIKEKIELKAMNKNEHLELEILVLQRLVGKMNLMLTDA